jgi:hypothetical protein
LTHTWLFLAMYHLLKKGVFFAEPKLEHRL